FEASRNISLGTITKIELAAQIVGLLCMLGWASIDRSIWALVAGTISAVMAITVMSHIWLPGTPNRWHWDQSAAQEIAHFGKWILMSSTLGFFISNGDRLLLGGFVNPTVLGLYVIAFGIYSAIEGGVTKMISDIMFPALSEIIRERPADLKISYY